MYGKVFASMFEGTLHGQWEAIVTMQQMIVLANQDGVVDLTPQALSARTSIPLDIIQRGLEVLSMPDIHSRTPVEEGRRIVLLDERRPWGWRLVNYGKYRRLVSAEQKRAADRERIAEKRKASKNNDVATRRTSSQRCAEVAQVDAEAEVEVKKNSVAPPLDTFEQAWGKYPARLGSNPKVAAKREWDARLMEGAKAEDMIAGVERYARYCQAMGILGQQFVRCAYTFFGPGRGYEESWTLPPGTVFRPGSTQICDHEECEEVGAATFNGRLFCAHHWYAERDSAALMAPASPTELREEVPA